MTIRKSCAILLAGVLLSVNASVHARMVLVEKGKAVAPIIVATDVSRNTLQAANDLADYIEKISDAKPTVLKGCPDPIPEHAIWVGYHPELNTLFPGTDFNFQHAEETLLVGNENHLAIVGRDLKAGNLQVEFGTVNAMYTFLQDKLGVRWFWPGESGEDIIRQDTLAFEPFEQRYHPQFRKRDLRGISVHATDQETKDWARYHRLSLGSLQMKHWTGFGSWGKRYHETHPEYLALQPDGTHEPAVMASAKVCMTNPQVREQWFADVGASLPPQSPALCIYSAAPSDGHNSGICVCEGCRAMDVQDGPIWGKYSWRGLVQEYVAMSDRYATFVNSLAQGLKERFPNHNLAVYDMAYGPNTPAPLRTVLADNTLIGYVGFFPLGNEVSRQAQKAEFAAWSEKAPHMMYRPNCWYFGGGVWGLPEVAIDKTIEDFHFLADHHCIGLDIDTALGHWGTQGIQYYLFAQMVWNPKQDGKALLADYYSRAFGPAAEEIERYWQIMDQARDAVNAHPKHAQGSRFKLDIVNVVLDVYNSELLKQAGETLRRAEAAVKNASKKYQKRVAFVRAGFTFVEKMFASATLMKQVRESKGADTQATVAVVALWEEIAALAEQFPFLINYDSLMKKMEPGSYMGGVQDFFGPPSEKYLKGLQGKTDTPPNERETLVNISIEGGQLSTTGLHLATSMLYNGRSPRFIEVGTAYAIKANLALTGYDTYLLEYDESYQFKLRTKLPFDSKVDFRSDTRYIKINYIFTAGVGTATYKRLDAFNTQLTFYSIGDFRLKEIKNNYMPETISLGFRMEKHGGDAGEEIGNKGIIRLPKSYDPKGAPTRLIIYAHGSANAHVNEFNASYMPYIKYLVAQGYAVADCRALGVNLDESSRGTQFWGTPQGYIAYESLYKHLMANFNLKSDIFLFGKSQGGLQAHGLPYLSTIPILASCPLAGSSSGIGNLFGYHNSERIASAKDFGFSGLEEDEEGNPIGEVTSILLPNTRWSQAAKDYLKKNVDKFAPYDPMFQGISNLTNLEILEWYFDSKEKLPSWIALAPIKQMKTPIKAFVSADDSGFYRGYQYQQVAIENGGGTYTIRLLPSGSGNPHHTVDTAGPFIESILTKSGEVHTNVPVAYVEMLEFFQEYE